MPTPSPKVDVVIPTYNAAELVRRCVDHLARDGSVDRVVVVDDASTEEIVRAFDDGPARPEIVRLDAHHGLAYAFNRGAERTAAEFILFLNNDVMALDGAVSLLATALGEDPGAASAGGRLVDAGTHTTQAAYGPRELPGLAALVARLVGIERHWPRNPWTGQHLTAPLSDASTQRTGRQPAGACVMVRRSAFEAVGGWDERYAIWYEDVDLSRRLLQIGPALYVPGATFEHIGGASTGGWRKDEQHRRLYHGTMAYAQAHLGRPQQVALGATMAAVCLPRYLIQRGRGSESAARTYRRLLASAVDVCRLRPIGPAAPDADRPGASR